jgi:hypothetical protein
VNRLIGLGIDDPDFDVVVLSMTDQRRQHKRRDENKVEKTAKFSVAKKRHFVIHLCHTFHHLLSIKKPRSARKISQKPLQNTTKPLSKKPSIFP